MLAPLAAGALLTGLVVVEKANPAQLSDLTPDRLLGPAAIFVAYAYAVTLALGVPTYFLLRGTMRVTALGCVLIGGVLHAAIWSLLFYGGRTFAEGVPHVLAAALPGAVSGLVFWIAAIAALRREATAS